MENRIIYYDEIDSTNSQIERLAAKGARHGTVVMARRQTAGKGRRGRTWESPEEDNLYMSLLLRPKLTVAQMSMLTLVMAYSATMALEGLGYSGIQIKWPNDLVMSGKKTCGILTELHMKGRAIDYVVIGVGVNVGNQAFPEELEDKATSLFLETGKKIDVQRLALDIVSRFEEEYERFVTVGDLSYIQKEYNARLVNCKKEVRILEPGCEYTAYAQGINQRGELVVQKEDGTEEAVFAGEVSVRGIYGYV